MSQLTTQPCPIQNNQPTNQPTDQPTQPHWPSNQEKAVDLQHGRVGHDSLASPSTGLALFSQACHMTIKLGLGKAWWSVEPKYGWTHGKTGPNMGQPQNQPASQPTQPDSGLQFVPKHTTQPVCPNTTNQPTNQPANQPASQPARQPTNQPASQPASQPGNHPTNQPTNQPNQPNQPRIGKSCQNTPPSLVRTKPTRQPTNQASNQPTNPT